MGERLAHTRCSQWTPQNFCGLPTFRTGKNKQGETLRIFLGDLCELNLGHTLAMTLGLQSSLPAAKLQEAPSNFVLSSVRGSGLQEGHNGVHSQCGSALGNLLCVHSSLVNPPLG